MSGIRRTLGTAPAKKAAAVTAELRRLVDVCPADRVRDRTHEESLSPDSELQSALCSTLRPCHLRVKAALRI